MKYSLNEILENETILNKHFEELNSLCSYLAMFPSYVPEKYIKELTKKGDIVYDPFSGRGTTSLQAIKLNRISISNDLSPLAFVLTKSKVKGVDPLQAIKRVENLKKKYIESNWKIEYLDDKYKDIRVFYSKHNLTQLDFLREKIGRKWNKLNDIDNYIISIALGIAHGSPRKTGGINNSLYFSVQMPNGYSMSPSYAEKYIEKNNLHKIETDIFEQIINRIKQKRTDFLPSNNENKVFLGDALKSNKYFLNKKEFPDLIFTSPPYLNLIKYVEQNWIRFWLLGYEKEETKVKIVDDYHAREEYKTFLVNFMLEMEKIMKKSTNLLMVIGDVNHNKIKDIMEEVMIVLNKKGSSLIFNGEPEPQELRNKLSRQMGNRIGKATQLDWVFKLKIK